MQVRKVQNCPDSIKSDIFSISKRVRKTKGTNTVLRKIEGTIFVSSALNALSGFRFIFLESLADGQKRPPARYNSCSVQESRLTGSRSCNISWLTTYGHQYGPDTDLFSLFHLSHAVIILFLFTFQSIPPKLFNTDLILRHIQFNGIMRRRPLIIRIITVLQLSQETFIFPLLSLYPITCFPQFGQCQRKGFHVSLS